MKRSVWISSGALFLTIFTFLVIYSLGVQRNQTPKITRAIGGWSTPCIPIPENVLTPVAATAPNGTVYVITDSPDGKSIKLYKLVPPCSSSAVATLAFTPQMIAQAQNSNVLGNVEANRPHLAFNKAGDLAVTFRVGTALYYARKPASAGSFNQAVLVSSNAYQGDVGIDSQKNVYVAWYSPGGYYRKYNSSDQLIGQTVTLTSQADSEPKLAIDSHDSVHLVWMQYPKPVKISYQKINADGTTGSILTLSTQDGNNVYPEIKIDSQDNVHLAWQAGDLNYQIYYRSCDNNGQNCSPSINVSNTSQSSLSPDLAVCGQTPAIAWYNHDSGQYEISAAINGTKDVVTPGYYGSFPGLTGSNGKLYVFFHNQNDQTALVTTNLASCSQSPNPTPAPMPSPTPTAIPNSTACQNNPDSPAACFDCNKDGQVNILDFACFAKWYGQNVNL